MERKKGFTLIEVVIVILMVAILATVAVPIMRARIEAAKWTEGKTIAGTIATAIRTWVIGATTPGPWNQISLSPTKLGFQPGDLNGIYFNESNFSWIVTYDGGKLEYVITIDRPDGISAPEKMTLDNNGQWTK
jgi:prepilin-type N-terminal cleavage/methylation domain-containing protein